LNGQVEAVAPLAPQLLLVMLAMAGHRPTTRICQLNPIESDIHTGWCPGSKLA
jgi:hypothetical protein